MTLRKNTNHVRYSRFILLSALLLGLITGCGSSEESLTDQEIVLLDQTTKQAWRLQSDRVGRIQGVEPVLPLVAPPDLVAMFSTDFKPTGYEIAFQQENVNFVICESLASCGSDEEVLQELDIDGHPIKVVYRDNGDAPKSQFDPVRVDELKDFWRTVELDRGTPNWMKGNEE